tara:strand:+ start:8907 stop:9914 length:1008 start_codon:yes stop_codon:yes gene_type:complete
MFKKGPYVIAEVGSNHLGNSSLCISSIKQAKNAGADCVKFQLFDENNLVNKKMKIYKHVKDKNLTYQYERFRKVKISLNLVKRLSKISRKNKIDFCVTPFDPKYVKQINKYVKFFKVASGDINNVELLKEIARTKKKVVISTGMSNIKEIERAISFFPKKNIILLHCISCYPTKFKDANLINIQNLKNKFKLEVGYSDHTIGIKVASNSVFFGATVIEKHFMPRTTKLAGDYKLSVDKKKLKQLVLNVKNNYEIIGKQRIGTYKCENYYKKTLRRSVYYSKNLNKDQKINNSNLNLLRPYLEGGLKIEDYKKILGSRLIANVKKNQLVKKFHFKK